MENDIIEIPQLEFPNFDQKQSKIEDNKDLVLEDTIQNFNKIIKGVQKLQEKVKSAQMFASESFKKCDSTYNDNQSLITDMQQKMKAQAKLLK